MITCDKCGTIQGENQSCHNCENNARQINSLQDDVVKQLREKGYNVLRLDVNNSGTKVVFKRKKSTCDTDAQLLRLYALTAPDVLQSDNLLRIAARLDGAT